MGLLPKLAQNVTSIGLDIGSNSIKLVQLQESKNGIALYKAGSAPTPKEAIRAGVVVDPLAIAKAIRALLDALQVEGGAVTAGVAGPTVVVREVPLPSMSDRQLRKSIQWEARNYISFPVEDSIVEFEVVDRPGPSEGSQMRVMLVAVPRDMVDSQVEAIELAGLEPVAIEIQPFAMMRGILASNGKQQGGGETTAVLDIGAAYTDITIMKDGQFILSRMIPIAGDAFTDSIRNALDIDTDEANQLKEAALQIVTSEEERATLDPAAQQASRAIEPLLDELIREVRRSLAYHDYQQQAPDAGSGEFGVNRILLSGGSARLPRLNEYIMSQLAVPVELAAIFGNGHLKAQGVNPEYLQSHSPTLLVGAGLALREIKNSKNHKGEREEAAS